MVDQIVEFFQDKLSAELIIFLISMLPVLELRGGLIAAALLQVDFPLAFTLCFIGNILPIPFILIFLKKIFQFMKRNNFLGKIVDRLERMGQKKSKKIDTFKMLGLFLFVAIPLPGTGAWTGALIAYVLGIRVKYSLPAIAAGVFCAGIIMSIISYAVPSLFGFQPVSLI